MPRAAFWIFILSLPSIASTFPVETERRALSASFGEYRPGRLHAGVDFATFGKTGLAVRAAASGRVIRVRSSTGGYGNAVYIQHEDGRRTVYAHLEGFSPRVAALLPRAAHRLGADSSGATMEVFPPSVVRVREGEIVGWTGESGAGMPHFHFEVRDAEDRPLNAIEAGFVSPRDRVAPVITSIIVEPAEPGAEVNGGGAPVVIESSSAGSQSPVAGIRAQGPVRILVSAYDEDGQLGGKLGIARLRLIVDGETWTDIHFSSFTYGRDRDAPQVYDFFRTGFSPTRYTYDLTAPHAAAESVHGRGPVDVKNERTVRVIIEDMCGNRAERSFNLGSRETRGARSAMNSDGEHISRGGIVILRNGIERRIRTEEEAAKDGDTCRVTRISPLAGLLSEELIDGVRLRGAPAGATIFAIRGGMLPAPPGATTPALLVGPYGLPLAAGAELSVRVDASSRWGGPANGLAQWTNDTWHWLGGSVSGGVITARVQTLAPVIAIRDAAPPVVSLERDDNAWRIAIRDEVSGINGELVRVTEEDASVERPQPSGRPQPLGRPQPSGRRPIAGRYDPDREAFIPDLPMPVDRSRWSVEAVDNVGNRVKTVVIMDPAKLRAR